MFETWIWLHHAVPHSSIWLDHILIGIMKMIVAVIARAQVLVLQSSTHWPWLGALEPSGISRSTRSVQWHVANFDPERVFGLFHVAEVMALLPHAGTFPTPKISPRPEPIVSVLVMPEVNAEIPKPSKASCQSVSNRGLVYRSSTVGANLRRWSDTASKRSRRPMVLLC